MKVRAISLKVIQITKVMNELQTKEALSSYTTKTFYT